MGEEDALGGDLVDGGGEVAGVSVTAESVGAEGVDEDEDDVGLGVG